MAFTAITTAQIQVGEPTAKELFQKMKDNFDDHESRIVSTENSINAILVIEFNGAGPYSLKGPQNEVMFTRISNNITVQGARLIAQTAGTAGSVEIDIKYKRGAGSWTTIFSTRPSVAFGAGDYALSTNAVLGVTSLLAGDLVRLDITAVQTVGVGFDFNLEYVYT
jgi:hypothetical protein